MKRLIDDPEIAGELRAELQRYAAEQAQVDLGRAYSHLQASLPKAAAPTIAPYAWSSLSGATKLLIVAAIGGSAALGIQALRGDEHAELATPAPISAAAARPALETPPQTSAASTSAPMPPSSGSSGVLPQPEAAATDAPKARTRGNASSASRREIAQLARIKALLEQDPAAARRLIRAAQREFPTGLLLEEREGLDVIALFALGQTERARKNAQSFIERYPQSPLRPKLERLIADASE